MDTHAMIVDFGKHKGQFYTRVPISYLRWMVNEGHPKADVARAELDRRGIAVQQQTVEISGHAIDKASLRVRRIWHETRDQDEGLHAWLLRMCEEAAATLPEGVTLGDEGRVYHNGMILMFHSGLEYPVLKTVMRDKRGTYGQE